MFNLDDIDRGSDFFYIDSKAHDFKITKEEAIIKIAEGKYTVKINGMEHLYPDSPSVHMFISPAGAISFPEHIDHENLKILCIEGEKGFSVDSKLYSLKPGEHCDIPSGVPHLAINEKASVILSIESGSALKK